MEFFLVKLLTILLGFFSRFPKEIHCQCGEQVTNVPVNTVKSIVNEDNYLIVDNIFGPETNIKTGDLLECEIIKTKSMESSNNDVHVFTQSSTTAECGYVFYPASKDKKCFSFQVRTTVFPHILLSATPSFVVSERLEVILEFSGNPNSVIRTKDGKHAATTPIKGIVNDKELRGFWIRWLDDHLLEVGRNTDDSPILSYRLPEKLSVNFIGILSYSNSAEWILHEDPHCGAYNITKKIKSESKCKVGTTKVTSEKINILEKSQQHILNQIKNLHEIFKMSKFRSKEILLEHQELIRMHFRNAAENQNKIYAQDNEIYCPLKSITFNEITQKYFQFLEELQIELASFKQVPAEIKSADTSLDLHCTSYSILQN